MMQARAVRIREPGGPEVLELGAIEVGEPGPGEVRVAVAAAGVNRADLLQRRGLYPAPAGAPPEVPGLEYAGEVEAVGSGVRDFREGDRVMGIAGGGALSTHLVVSAREVLAVPDGMTLTDAAAVPEVFLTAYDALFLRAGLSVGQVVLVHAVGSGVGTAALQLARTAGATVAGTSRTEEKLERSRGLGLEHPILVRESRFADAVREALAGREPAVVLDLVGGAYLGENLRVVRPRGRVVVVGLVGGVRAEADLGLLLRKRIHLVGTVLRSRPPEEKAALAQRFASDVLPLLESGTVRPVIDEVLPMERAAEAHERMERNATFGKLVLRW